MKWVLEIPDVPRDTRYPVVGNQKMDNGVKRGPFYYRVEDVVSALTAKPDVIISEDELINHTPLLPRGTLMYGENKDKTVLSVTMEHPKKMFDIRYAGDDELYCIGFPRLIIQYKLESCINKRYRITEMKVYAVEDDGQPITHESKIYYFPYPNVSPSHGLVCWGNNERVEIDSLVELERALIWFVSAPFSEDYGVRTTLGITNFKQLISKIKNKPFDDDWLVPVGKRFGDIFNKSSI